MEFYVQIIKKYILKNRLMSQIDLYNTALVCLNDLDIYIFWEGSLEFPIFPMRQSDLWMEREGKVTAKPKPCSQSLQLWYRETGRFDFQCCIAQFSLHKDYNWLAVFLN